MIGSEHAFGVGQDRVVVLDTAIGRQTTVALAEAHRTSSGMESDADGSGPLDLVVEA